MNSARKSRVPLAASRSIRASIRRLTAKIAGFAFHNSTLNFPQKGHEFALNTESARDAVYAYLDSLGISYRSMHHAPAATMADCEAVSAALGATECKNYFLTTKSHKIFCLLLTRPNARFKTADVSKQAGTPRLSFADENDMACLLSTYPGAVSPMGLIFDSENRVRLLVDSALRTAGELAFHPCDNSESLAMKTVDFLNLFLPALKKSPEWIEIHDFEA